MDERSLAAGLRAEGFDVTVWDDDPGATYPEHRHPYAESRIVLTGSMSFTTAGTSISLGPGDRIDFEAGQPHAATVGSDGVRYLAGTRR